MALQLRHQGMTSLLTPGAAPREVVLGEHAPSAERLSGGLGHLCERGRGGKAPLGREPLDLLTELCAHSSSSFEISAGVEPELGRGKSVDCASHDVRQHERVAVGGLAVHRTRHPSRRPQGEEGGVAGEVGDGAGGGFGEAPGLAPGEPAR